MSSAPAEAPRPLAPEPSPEDRAPVETPPEDTALLVVRAAFLTPERVKPSALLLLVSLALYALTALGGQRTWVDVVLLVGVLLFHELGHWLGMRAFGYQNVRMFFIPFFGAAVSGRNTSASAWKEAVVLLLGPLPGLVLGCLLVIIGRRLFPSPLLAEVAMLLVALNGFNLLPVAPLDGGRLFQLLVFSRHRHLENAFTVFAALVLLAGAFAAGDKILGFLGVLMLVGVPRQVGLLRQVHALRTAHPGVAQPPEALDTASLRALHEAASALAPAEAPLDTRIQLMRNLHDRVRQRPPALLACLGLGTLWAGGVLLTLVGLVLVAYLGR